MIFFVLNTCMFSIFAKSFNFFQQLDKGNVSLHLLGHKICVETFKKSIRFEIDRTFRAEKSVWGILNVVRYNVWQKYPRKKDPTPLY